MSTNMRYVEAPNEYLPTPTDTKTLFLGGGITNCPDWQSEVYFKLPRGKFDKLVLFNPRRENFDVNDPSASRVQIEWEFRHLKYSKARLFWFPKETLCPITLYELGKYVEKVDTLIVGCHPEYQRKIDLEIQIGLHRPNYQLSYSIDDIVLKIEGWYNE